MIYFFDSDSSFISVFFFEKSENLWYISNTYIRYNNKNKTVLFKWLNIYNK